VLGGNRWDSAERQLADQPSEEALTELKRAISNKRSEMGLGAALTTKRAELVNATIGERVSRLASLTKTFLDLSTSSGSLIVVEHRGTIIRRLADRDNLAWLCEFALRLASSPEGITEWAGEHLNDGLVRLFEVPALARAARFLVLAIDLEARSGPAEEERLYAGWDW